MTDSFHLAAPSSSRTSGDAAPNAPSAYAPEPWNIDREFKQVHVIAGRSAVARVMHGRDDGEANARLIAAAPDSHEANKVSLLVLCALEKANDWHPNMAKDITFAIEANRAAIAKALGTPTA